ncbi:hypothetical protein OAH58_00970 [bacterium]|nr:hypothetical protein [bacterium]
MNLLLGIYFLRGALEAAFGPERMGVNGGGATPQIPQGALDFLTMQIEDRGVPVLNWASRAEQHVMADETKL